MHHARHCGADGIGSPDMQNLGSRLDLLVCRNSLMYLNAETQARVLSKFHFAINGDGQGNGYLFLGRAEMLLTHSALFKPLDLKCRIFAKVPTLGERQRAVPAVAVAPAPGNGDNGMMNDKLRSLALDESPIARIVVDGNGVLALANQRARALFSLLMMPLA